MKKKLLSLLCIIFLILICFFSSDLYANERNKGLKELDIFFREPLTKQRMEYFFTNNKEHLYSLYFQQRGRKYRKEFEKLACYATLHYPDKMFGPMSGGHLDSITPICSEWSITNKLPETKPLFELLHDLSGTCCGGSSRIYKSLFNSINEIKLGANIALNISGNSSNCLLKNWSLNGIWEKEQVTKLRQLQKQAVSIIANYYQINFDLREEMAIKRAEDNIRAYQEAVFISGGDEECSTITEELDSLVKDSSKINKIKSEYNISNLLTTGVVHHYPIDVIQAMSSKIKESDMSCLIEPIHQSAPYYTEALKVLIRNFPSEVNSQNRFGKTALMYAIQYRNIDAVKFLLKNGADVNLNTCTIKECQTKYGFFAMDADIKAYNRTPLMYAAWHGNLEIIKILLKAGAKKDIEHEQYMLNKMSGKLAYNYLDLNENLTPEDLEKARNLLKVEKMQTN